MLAETCGQLKVWFICFVYLGQKFDLICENHLHFNPQGYKCLKGEYLHMSVCARVCVCVRVRGGGGCCLHVLMYLRVGGGQNEHGGERRHGPGSPFTCLVIVVVVLILLGGQRLGVGVFVD